MTGTLALAAIALSLAVGVAVAWIMPMIPEPPVRPRPLVRASFLLVAATGCYPILANLIGGAHYAFPIPFALAPLPIVLLVTAVGLFGLYASTGSDIFYDRMISREVLLYPTALILGLYLLAVPFVGYPALILAAAGAAAGWLTGKLMGIPARFMARRMEMPIDELTGEQGEAFGEGDVWVLMLVGALLGPFGMLLMLLIGSVIGGAMSILVMAYDHFKHNDVHLFPYVPALCAATIYVLLSSQGG